MLGFGASADAKIDRSSKSEPINKTAFSDEFLRKIPKADLHVHLDGSLRIGTVIDLAKELEVELPAYTEAGLRELVFKETYDSLEDYLKGFMYTGAVMSTAKAIERVAYEFAVDNFSEGVRYFEVRFAPQLHVNPEQPEKGISDIASVIAAVNIGLARAKQEFNEKDAEVVDGTAPRYEYGIIVCAMRFWNQYFSKYYAAFWKMHEFLPEHRIMAAASLALVTAAVEHRDLTNTPVIGFDLAGAEMGYEAVVHKEAFEFAHANFLKKTVHAGEGYGPESIYQAVNKVGAQRIGHGFHIFSSDKVHSKHIKDPTKWTHMLGDYVADRRIALEVCLTSNLQTMPDLKGDVKNHKFGQMLEAKMSVVLATDNRLVSDTTLCKEIRLACDNFDLEPDQLKHIVVDGFKRSFFHLAYTEKRAYVRKVIDYYDKIAAECL